VRNTSGLKRDAGPGRPKGSKDKVPRTARAAVTALIERLGADTELIESVLRKGLSARAPSSFPYLRLLIEQNIGAPEQTHTLDWSKKCVDELHPGPSQTA
jgi:hypothetical protein